MVDEIYALKNHILEYVEKETQDMDRIDVKEIGELVDMVKDLAEAEEKCWEATYYRTVSQAMESGGSEAPTQRGYEQQRQVRKPVGFTSYTANDDVIKKLGEEYRSLPQDERMMMKTRVLNMLGSM